MLDRDARARACCGEAAFLDRDQSPITDGINRPRLLVAVSHEGRHHVRRALSDCYELVFVGSVEELIAPLDEPFDGAILGIHFDDSRMFESVQAMVAPRPIPFVCCLLKPTKLA